MGGEKKQHSHHKHSHLDDAIQLLIPPSLVLLLTITIVELFYPHEAFQLWIEIFDLYVITIFAIDLYFRWKEEQHIGTYLKKYWIDILATIPFNLIFIGLEQLVLTRGFRGIRILTRIAKLAKYTKLIRIARMAIRLPRFMRIRHYVKKTKVRQKQPHEKEMKGVLSFPVILLVTINSIMGTGIWFLTATGAKHAGPASLISWFILSLISIYIAMCFAELTAMFPKAGGVYEFAKQAYGRFWSFMIGWSTSIAGSVTIAMLLLGSLQYLIPLEYSHWYIPIALVFIIGFNYMAYRGLQTSTFVLVTFAIITLGTVLGIIIPGLFQFESSNLVPFLVFPTANILLAIFFIAETFFGWESAIFLSAETKNPKKVMPKALIYGTMVIAALALLLAFVGVGAVPWTTFAESDAPLRTLGESFFGPVGGVAFTLLVFTSIIGAVACWIVTAPRLLMSIAEDKLFFVQFAKIHPRNKSPYISILFQVVLITFLVVVGSGSYETLLHMLVPLILFIYSTVLLAVVILRFKKPDFPRAYKVPFGTVGPLLTIVFMGFLLYMYVLETHHAFELLRITGFLVVLGTPAYFFIEIFYDKRYVVLRRNIAAKLLYHAHSLPLSNAMFKKTLNYVGPLHPKSIVLDYNCGVGAFTRMLLRREIPFKKIYAVDQGKEEIEVFREHIPRDMRARIHIDYRQSWRLPKTIPQVDAFVSFNALGYIKNVETFLSHVRNILKKNGKFCFHINQHVLNITPNALLIEDAEKVKKLFKESGLKAEYKRIHHGFSDDIFIWGKK